MAALNLCNYFLWGYLKSRVYNPLPRNLDDLKANIDREIKNISTDTLTNEILNFSKRCDLLKLKQVILKTFFNKLIFKLKPT